MSLSSQEIEYAFYDKFFFSKNLEPYAVQEKAFTNIFVGNSVLVTVPTGTGKTLIAKAALFSALQRKKTAIYTTPLRALTEEKYREFCDDFGVDNVGFATGDYKVNPKAPIQVVVAEILWNRIVADRVNAPAQIVVMDEGHYFNDPERGYVWEQSIIGLDPRTQLIILSATIGQPEQFCTWVHSVRKIPLELVTSEERRVPLFHRYQERYLIEVVRDLFAQKEYPAIIFCFGRELCFEVARLLKSCPRFTTDDERREIARRAAPILLGRGLSEEFLAYLLHGISIHHAGILPRYKQLVEELTLDRLIKFVVSTETISAGINLPAKRVIFPALRKFIQGKPRLLISAEYHQMAGRAGRPQFDTEGVAITLAPEEVVQEARKELKDAARGRFGFDEAKIWKNVYTRAKTEAIKNNSILWDQESHEKLVQGMPAPLLSKTKVTPEQILAIGLPDLTETIDLDLPAYQNFHIKTVIANLLIGPKERADAAKRTEMVVENLKALQVIDEKGLQISGQVINKLRGIDGLFVYFYLQETLPDEEITISLLEFLVDHDAIQRIFDRREDEKKREWIRNRLKERRREEASVTWEDCETEYLEKFPRELTPIELLHSTFLAKLPHPELHGGKRAKKIWADMRTEELSFLDYVEKHKLDYEEGNLFTYLARLMKTARMLYEATEIEVFAVVEEQLRLRLAVIDDRLLDTLW